MFKKIVSLLVVLAFSFQQLAFAQVGVAVDLSGLNPAQMSTFRPLHLRSLSYDMFTRDFRLMLEKGSAKIASQAQLEKETGKLFEYFLTGLSLPDKSFWVNLRPDSTGKIIDPMVEKTDLGKAMLAADVQLKKDLANLTSPATKLGKEYWNKLYKKAEALYGNDATTIPTVSRPWIVPGEIIMCETPKGAYVYKAVLDVKLEEDHLKNSTTYNFTDDRAKELNAYSSQLLRDTILPRLVKEVNSSKKYAELRQVFYSLILAQWFKKNSVARNSDLASRIDSNNLAGISSKTAWSKETYYNAYRESFNKGEYSRNESVQTATGAKIRSYTSGGADFEQLTQGALHISGNYGSIVGQSIVGARISLDRNGDIDIAVDKGATVTRNGKDITSHVRKITDEDIAGLKTQKRPLTVAQDKKDGGKKRGFLEKGWVLANHVLVSFHASFVSSVLMLSPAIIMFIFASPETIISGIMWYIGWHTCIAIHEMGHYFEAGKQFVLNEASQEEYNENMKKPFVQRLPWYAKIFLTAPWGRFQGIKRYGGFPMANYTYDGSYNLYVKAAGPAVSKKLALITMPPAAILLAVGLFTANPILILAGRFFLVPGIISFLDFKFADEGALGEVKEREEKAKRQADAVEATATGDRWIDKVADVRELLVKTRPMQVGEITAPRGWRNCAMGGRHTEEDYPESNISLQEGMFLPLRFKNYEEAQEITVRLQNRLKQIIEKTPGCRVMGIGLEGGLAPYITPDKDDIVPELKLWRLMTQAIKDEGLVPGVDVAIALDPATSELEIAYRDHTGEDETVGMYYFWRYTDNQVMLSNEQMLDRVFMKAIEEDIPIVTFEDPFAEDDYNGYSLMMKKYGDKFMVIGDDLITTNDNTIEQCALKGLINSALIKPNQIGSVSETMLAMLMARAHRLELVISHRSKSPNNPIEAILALATNAMGLKAGGGANTERLVKYGYVTQAINDLLNRKGKNVKASDALLNNIIITSTNAWEEPTNAGIPTVAVKVKVGLRSADGSVLDIGEYNGATPLGTSAGTGEAIHLIDSVIFKDEAVVKNHGDLLEIQKDGTYRFKKELTKEQVAAKGDAALNDRFAKANRYKGKGCLTAVDNAQRLLKQFEGKSLNQLGSVLDLDRMMLKAEIDEGIRRGYLKADASEEEKVKFAQRKGMLGMNNILSVSIALTQALEVKENMKSFEILREEMRLLALKVVNENYKAVGYSANYEDAIGLLQEYTDELKSKGERLTPILRKAADIYSFDGGVATPAKSVVDGGKMTGTATEKTGATTPEEKRGGIDFATMPINIQGFNPAAYTIPPSMFSVPAAQLESTWKQVKMKFLNHDATCQELIPLILVLKQRADTKAQADEVGQYVLGMFAKDELEGVRSSDVMKKALACLVAG